MYTMDDLYLLWPDVRRLEDLRLICNETSQVSIQNPNYAYFLGTFAEFKDFSYTLNRLYIFIFSFS
jgi:hypothetical protein